MNVLENPNDNQVTRELHFALGELALPTPPQLAAIIGRSRARRHERLVAVIAGLSIVAIFVGTTLALTLTATLQPSSVSSTGAIHGATPRVSARPAKPETHLGTIQTASFILTGNTNGTDTLTLTMNEVLDAPVLQRALAEHGIPAIVKTGIYCSSTPPAPDPVKAGVLSIRLASGPPKMVPVGSGLTPEDLKEIAARTATLINPSALPAGTELFFGYSTTFRAVFTDLIYTDSYSCSSNP